MSTFTFDFDRVSEKLQQITTVNLTQRDYRGNSSASFFVADSHLEFLVRQAAHNIHIIAPHPENYFKTYVGPCSAVDSSTHEFQSLIAARNESASKMVQFSTDVQGAVHELQTLVSSMTEKHAGESDWHRRLWAFIHLVQLDVQELIVDVQEGKDLYGHMQAVRCAALRLLGSQQQEEMVGDEEVVDLQLVTTVQSARRMSQSQYETTKGQLHTTIVEGVKIDEILEKIQNMALSTQEKNALRAIEALRNAVQRYVLDLQKTLFGKPVTSGKD